MDQVLRWIQMYYMSPEIFINNIKYIIDKECFQMPDEGKTLLTYTQSQLEQLYPNQPGDLSELLNEDMKYLFKNMEQLYTCNKLVENLQNLPELIINLLVKYVEEMLKRISQKNVNMEGGKFTYKGRKYVIRDGERSGKYILVKNKKVYLSQI